MLTLWDLLCKLTVCSEVLQNQHIYNILTAPNNALILRAYTLFIYYFHTVIITIIVFSISHCSLFCFVLSFPLTLECTWGKLYLPNAIWLVKYSNNFQWDAWELDSWSHYWSVTYQYVDSLNKGQTCVDLFLEGDFHTQVFDSWNSS